MRQGAQADEGSTDATATAGSDPIGVVVEAHARAVFEPGTVLASRYRVVRFIARGGMSEVYEVEDLLTGAVYSWYGRHNWVRLDPRVQPAHILRVRRLERATVPAEA